MFIRIDNKTQQEEIISSEAMALVLEEDLRADAVDEALTDIVTGLYKHRNRDASYVYRL